jgi:glycerate 2-kinase
VLPVLRQDAARIVAAALARVDAGRLVSRALTNHVSLLSGPLYVLAAGKASVSMANAFAAAHGSAIQAGLVIAPDAPVRLLPPLTALRGAHPVPDDRSVAAAHAALALAATVPAGGTLVVLLSGGASALMALPAEGVTLAVKQQVTRTLLRADADIHAINCVRKHLSGIKGGRLAAACAGAVLTLAISDVVGDDPSVIASGPTIADPTSFADALAVIDRAAGRSAFPGAAVRWLEAGGRGLHDETPKPGDPRLARSVMHVIGSRDAMDGAADAARTLGYAVRIVGEPIVGEARRRGSEVLDHLARVDDAGPRCVITSGETTVHVTGPGRGGRNQELALAAVAPLAHRRQPTVLASVGTDGVDGPTDAAGALTDSTTAARAAERGLDPLEYLDANDAWAFFDALGDLVRTGPTGTNVGDLQVLLTRW